MPWLKNAFEFSSRYDAKVAGPPETPLGSLGPPWTSLGPPWASNCAQPRALAELRRLADSQRRLCWATLGAHLLLLALCYKHKAFDRWEVAKGCSTHVLGHLRSTLAPLGSNTGHGQEKLVVILESICGLKMIKKYIAEKTTKVIKFQTQKSLN